MDDDDIGTVRWFGQSWGAPINDPRTQIDTPAGLCIECDLPMVPGGQGVSIPSAEGRVAFHKICFFQSLGILVESPSFDDLLVGEREEVKDLVTGESHE